MNTKTFKTPSGYTVEIKTDLIYGEYEDIQTLMNSSISFDPKTGMPGSFSGESIKAANRLAFDYLIVKIEKDGIPYAGSIRELNSKDGRKIKEEIDAVLNVIRTEDTEDEAKKNTTS